MEKKNNTSGFVKIVLSLLIISAFIVGMLATVNALTKDVIRKNQDNDRNNAIKAIFGEDITVSPIEVSINGVREMYDIAYEGKTGKCIEVETSGYGGTIVMMVGFDSDSSVKGISIVEISETAGLGSRVANPDYLSQYVGKQSEMTIADIDVIAQSTISSRAVMAGVNTAIYALGEYEGGN